MTLKAAILTPNLSWGGAERWIACLLKHTRDRIDWQGVAVRGFEATERELCQEIVDLGVPIVGEPPMRHPVTGGPTPGSRTEAACRDLIERVDTFEDACQKVSAGVDIVVGWYFCDYRKLVPRGIPVIHTMHLVERVAPLQGVDYIVGVSQESTRYLGNQKQPFHVIWNGVDVDQLQPTRPRDAIRAKWGLTPNDRVVGFLGRFVEQKRAELVTEAIIKKQFPSNWHVVLYGIGKNHIHCKHPNVQIHKPVIHVGDVYGGLDVLAMPSLRETFSLVLIEGWLSKVPVVITPVGVVLELRERFGDLAFYMTSKPIATELARLSMQALKPDSKRIIDRAYHVADRYFRGEHMGNRWVDYLHRIVDRRPPPAGLYLGERRNS